MNNQYIKHDLHSRSDEKIIRLILELGFEGYGVYWAVIEKLYMNGGWLKNDIELISFDIKSDKELIKKVIKSFDLFVENDNRISSRRVLKNLSEIESKSLKAKHSADARWKNESSMRSHCEPYARREEKRREEKRREKKHDAIHDTKAFDLFWSIYPKKFNKAAAFKAWNKIKFDDALLGKVLEAVRQQITWPDWKKDGGQYIPYASTWINGERWNDQITKEATDPHAHLR